MSDLIERLRYKYADILHREAADRLEELEVRLGLSNDYVDSLVAMIESLTDELFAAELRAKTYEEGYNESQEAIRYHQARVEELEAALRIVPGFATNRARADFVKYKLAAIEQGENDELPD